MQWTLNETARAIGGQLLGGDATYRGVVTDSRAACQDQLFVALSGPRFDGHDDIAAAAEAGAAAALVSRSLPDCPLPQVLVADTRQALGELARAWRAQVRGRVVAITGSNGKTTCKEMVAAILRQVGSVHATSGNLNNDIGLPLTLLGEQGEDFLVLEMGANHPGEIAVLSAIARPEVALITNAGRAHLEGFGSIEGVAHAKGEIASGLPPDGCFVFMADVPWTALWQGLAAGRRTLTFGTGPSAQVRANEEAIGTHWDADGFRTEFIAELATGIQLPVRLQLAGRHNARNALAAIALSVALGIAPEAIIAGLAQVRPVARRLQPRLGVHGPRLLDDSYNANPDSLDAAIDVLVSLPGRRLLVLGDFGELGSDSLALHRDMGLRARAAGVDRLFCLGQFARAAAEGFGDLASVAHTPDELLRQLRAELRGNDLVLVKGSRAAGMDRVADAILHAGPGASPLV